MKKNKKHLSIAIIFSVSVLVALILAYFGSWYQVLGAWTSSILPSELNALLVEGKTNLQGFIYFDATRHMSKGEPGTNGNFLLALNTESNEITAIRANGLAMKFERHTQDILSYYDYSPLILLGQQFKMINAGIPIATGGEMILINPDFKQIGTISDALGVDLHDFVISGNGNYIYLSAHIESVYPDSTITCLPECYMLFQSIVEVSPNGQEIYRYPLSQYYTREQFTMDDVLMLGSVPVYDLTHANSVSLAEDDNMLIVSVRHTNEVLAISRADGSLIWRTSDFEFVGDSLNGFRHQHDASFRDGKLLLFDNGNGRDGAYSRVVEYQINITEQTATLSYEYMTPDRHYAPNRGSVTYIADGKFLVNWVNRDKGDIEIINEAGEIELSISIPGAYASYQANFWGN